MTLDHDVSSRHLLQFSVFVLFNKQWHPLFMQQNRHTYFLKGGLFALIFENIGFWKLLLAESNSVEIG